MARSWSRGRAWGLHILISGQLETQNHNPSHKPMSEKHPTTQTNGPGAHGHSMTSFDALYDRDTPAYGFTACPELQAVLNQNLARGLGLDLGAGAGRDTLAMARNGLLVTAIDASSRGIERLRQFAAQEGLEDLIDAQVGDVLELQWAGRNYGLINAVTVLDHIDRSNIDDIWRAMCDSLAPQGIMNVQVHTVADPGCDDDAGPVSEAPSSESAEHIQHYFEPNELLDMASGSLKVLRYEQRLERDETHGSTHMHSKASLLATRHEAAPRYFGYPSSR